MFDLLGGLVQVVVAVAMLYFVVWLFVLLPSRMARERRRDPVIWVLISLVGSPLLAILLLTALGEAPANGVRTRF